VQWHSLGVKAAVVDKLSAALGAIAQKATKSGE
jgi:hypothetical protein